MAPKTSKSKSKLKLKSKSPKSNLKQRKSTSKFGGSLPRSNPRVGSSQKLKLEHLPNEMLQLIYDKIPKGKDRVALASTSSRMNNVGYAFESVEHFIRTQADVEAAIKNSAERVTFKNGALVKELVRMPRVKYLSVKLLGLSELPMLPPTLRTLDCTINNLTELPVLPSTLKKLNYSYNHNPLRRVPILPPNLISLHCIKAGKLPKLPSTLKELDCQANNLEQLPTLPPTLVSLFCTGNNLTKLPALPPTLKVLDCAGNVLGNLPARLPPTLIDLSCSENELTRLPKLPSICTGNPLKVIQC